MDEIALTAALGVGALLGAIPAVLAHRKGYDWFVWWLFGAFVFPVALVLILLRRTDTSALEQRAIAGGRAKRCPHCAALVAPALCECPHCSKAVPPAPEAVAFDLRALTGLKSASDLHEPVV